MVPHHLLTHARFLPLPLVSDGVAWGRRALRTVCAPFKKNSPMTCSSVGAEPRSEPPEYASLSTYELRIWTVWIQWSGGPMKNTQDGMGTISCHLQEKSQITSFDPGYIMVGACSRQ